MPKTVENFYEFISIKLMTFPWIEKMPQKMVLLPLILHIRIKGQDVGGYVKSIGDSVGKWEKANWGNHRLYKK